MSEIKVDTISERTSANGVAVDGVTIKDSGLTIPSGGTLTIDSGGTITNNGTASGLGGLILLSESTNSSSVSELVFTIPNLTDYNFYYFYFTDLVNASVGSLRMQLSTDGGSTFLTSGYEPGSGSYIDVTRPDVTAVANGLFSNVGMYIFPRNDDSTAYKTGVSLQSGVFKRSATPNHIAISVYFSTVVNSTTSSINAFKIFMSGGNLSGGKFKLYGIVD